MNEKIVIIDAGRTPVGKYDGALSDLTAVELGTHVVKNLLKRHENLSNDVSQVIFGNVLQAGNGQNVARQITINSGLSNEIPAFTVNEVCGSGLKAILLAAQILQLNPEKNVVVAGGTESMSNAPMVKNRKTDEENLTMFSEGLHDAFSGEPMGIIAENIAKKYGISRQVQDEFAQKSQEKAGTAQKSGIFDDEIIPVGDVKIDQPPRANSTLESLSNLRTIFDENGTVTAGNASPVNDGASAVILATETYANEHQLPILAKLIDSSEVGIDPEIMGVSPIKAIRELLTKTDLDLNDIDLFEINEAFASSSVAVNRELGLDENKVNIAGGAIGLGHAIGSSGARITTTLSHLLKNQNKKYGIASLCIGGGLGLALLLENPNYGQ